MIVREPSLTYDVVTCVTGAMVPQLEAFRDMLIAEGVAHWRLFSIFPMGRAKNDPSLRMTDAQFREMLEFIRTYPQARGRIGDQLCLRRLPWATTRPKSAITSTNAPPESRWLRSVSTAPFRAARRSVPTSIRATSTGINSGTCGKTASSLSATAIGRGKRRMRRLPDVPLLSGRRHAPPRRRRRTAVLPLPPTVDTPYRNYYPDMLLRIITRSLPHICRERRSKPALGSGFCRLTALRQHFRRRRAAYRLRVNLKLSRSGR